MVGVPDAVGVVVQAFRIKIAEIAIPIVDARLKVRKVLNTDKIIPGYLKALTFKI